MKVFAISDLHLHFSTPSKVMHVFGEQWRDHFDKIKESWESKVGEKDLVLIPGDISWASRLDDAIVDLDWIHRLPGTKIILKGNHDRWWKSFGALKKNLPPSIIPIHKNHYVWNDVIIFGARLWDTTEYQCNDIIHWRKTNGDYLSYMEVHRDDDLKYDQELNDLKQSIRSLPSNHEEYHKIGLCHYPPTSPAMEATRAVKLYQDVGTSDVVFGHLHSLKDGLTVFGEKQGVHFHLTACDYLNFELKEIYSSKK